MNREMPSQEGEIKLELILKRVKEVEEQLGAIDPKSDEAARLRNERDALLGAEGMVYEAKSAGNLQSVTNEADLPRKLLNEQVEEVQDKIEDAIRAKNVHAVEKLNIELGVLKAKLRALEPNAKQADKDFALEIEEGETAERLTKKLFRN